MTYIPKHISSKIVDLVIANDIIAHDLYTNNNEDEKFADLQVFIKNSTKITDIVGGYDGTMRYLNTMRGWIIKNINKEDTHETHR